MNSPRTIFVSIAVGFIFLFSLCVAWATPPEQNRHYGGGKKGPVLFSYDTHARLGGLVCADCHSADGKGLFDNRPYEFTMKDHRSGTLCWSCHDGKRAERSCKTCHY